MSGWFVTNKENSAYIHPHIAGPNMIAINHQDAKQQLKAKNYYWMAPQAFLGNKVCLNHNNSNYSNNCSRC